MVKSGKIRQIFIISCQQRKRLQIIPSMIQPTCQHLMRLVQLKDPPSTSLQVVLPKCRLLLVGLIAIIDRPFSVAEVPLYQTNPAGDTSFSQAPFPTAATLARFCILP